MLSQHRFYGLSSSQQQRFQLKVIVGFLALNIAMGLVFYLTSLLFVIPFFFAFSLSVIAPFVDVPSGVKNGTLHYYSPLLIGEKIKGKKLTLHSGSLFDYYFVFSKAQSVQERKKQVMIMALDGLIQLINDYQARQGTGITIKVTSYILNRRTARKIGLSPITPDALQWFLLYFNFLNLTCSLSLLNRQLTWPNVRKTTSYEGCLESLIAKKDDLLKLRNRLSES